MYTTQLSQYFLYASHPTDLTTSPTISLLAHHLLALTRAVRARYPGGFGGVQGTVSVACHQRQARACCLWPHPRAV
eukprot:2097218-Rhodomonas_salina.1